MCFDNKDKNNKNAISFDESETKECINENQKNKNAKLMLGKELINIGKRQCSGCSFCDPDNFILRRKTIFSLLKWGEL